MKRKLRFDGVAGSNGIGYGVKSGMNRFFGTVLLFMMVLMSGGMFGQIIFENPITGTNPNTSNPYTTGQTVDANITVSGIGRGSGITGTNANNRYTANNWNSSSLNTNDYFTFTLTPNSGYDIDFVSFVYTGQASGTGPTNFVFRSSIDSYVANIGTANATGQTIDLSGASYQNLNSPITFRIYAWGATSDTGTFSINHFEFNGVVSATSTNTITTSAITGSPFCVTSSAGTSVNVPFTSTGTFTSGNVYTAQLSNASGGFASPVNIGTLSSTLNSGTISANIPSGTATGTGYRIRVVSSAPAVTGSDNGTNLTINLASNSIAPATTQNIATGVNGTALNVTETSTPLSRVWKYGTTSGGPYSTTTASTGTSYIPNFATANTYYVVCESTFNCGTITSNQVQINVTAPPANDNCGTVSGILTVNAVATNATMVSSTVTAGNTFTYGDTKKDVWYSFSPTCTGSHTVTTTFASGDIDVDIFTASCPTGGTASFTAHGSGTTETITNTFNSGTTYYIRVIAWNTVAETATFTIRVTGAVPEQPGVVTPTNSTTCVGVSQTYTIAAVANATSYTWTFPSGWVVDTPSTTNTINVTPSSTTGNVSVTANNCYGSGVARALNVTPVAIPATPGTITGLPSVCTGTSNTYSIATVSGATSYTWTLPSGWMGTSTTNSITVTAGTSGTISVIANNDCGSSSPQTLSVIVNAATNPSGSISVVNETCGTTTITYSAPSAAIYWQTSPTGTSTANPTTSNYVATSSQTYYARAFDGSCWSATSASLPVAVSIAPAITTQPASQLISTGNPVTFSVVTTGTIASFQWQINTGSGWNNVAPGNGDDTDTYTITSTTLAMDGHQFRCLITADAPCTDVTSATATLSVVDGPCYETTFPTNTLPSGWVSTGSIIFSGSPDNNYFLQFNGASQYATLPFDAELIDHIEFDLKGSVNNPNLTLKVQSSDDNSTWADVDTYLGTTITNEFATKISSTIDKKYVRFLLSVRGGNAVQIDNVKIFCSNKTVVLFTSASQTIEESLGANLCLRIVNPSATTATTADIVLTSTSGTGGHTSTTTYPVTFPAGSSENQCVSIDLSDNTTCFDTSTYTYEIQNLAGGTTPLTGSIDTSTLTVNDNDSTPTLINETFDTGFGNFKKVDEDGSGYTYTYTSPDTHVYINGFGSGVAQKDYLIYRNPINFDIGTAESLVVNYSDRRSGTNIGVYYSTDFNGVFNASSTTAATWTLIGNLNTLSTSSSYSAFTNQSFNLAGLTGTNVYIALRYTSNTSNFKEYRIGNISLNVTGYCGTVPTTVCIPSNSIHNVTYISQLDFVGTQNDISNPSTNVAGGYQDFTGLTSNPSQYQGEAVNMKLTTNGNTAMVKAWIDLNRDGDFDDANEQIFDSMGVGVAATTFGYQVPITLPAGDYRIRVRAEDSDTGDENFGSCDDLSTAGETEDYLLTVLERCSADIETVTSGERCGTGSVTLQASTVSSGVTEFRWYTAPTGGSYTTSSNIGNATTFNSPSISSSTTYYVTAYSTSDACETNIRKAVRAIVKEVPDISFTPALPVACGDNTPIVLTAEEGLQTVYLVDESFDTTGNNFSNTSFKNTNIESNGSAINQISRWEKKTSTFTPTDGEDTWAPAISSGFGTNKFAFSNSDVGSGYTIDHGLDLTNAINTTDFQNLTLSFRLYFSRYLEDNVDPNDEYVSVEVSTNGGTTFGPLATPVKYTTDEGTPANFATKTIDISSYVNQTNLKFRIRYYSDVWAEGVAVDDIQIYGSKTLTASYSWSGSDIVVFTDEELENEYVPGTEEDTVYIIPGLGLLENTSFDIVITTTLTNGCPLVQTIPVTNNSKVWAGVTNDWNTASNWKPAGIPTNANCIVIPNTTVQPTIPSTTDVVGKSIKIKDNAQLVIPSGSTLTITDEVNVEPDGLLEISNSGSLLQITNVDNATANNNSGKINMFRTAKPMFRYDFTYWSSPVVEDATTFLIGKNPSNLAIPGLSPSTFFDKYYHWDAVAQNWLPINWGNAAMAAGKGYIVRAPQSYNVEGNGTPGIFNTKFIGIPNNGIINRNVVGDATANKWNLLGNPYPSALNIEDFLTANQSLLEGIVYIWTHNTRIEPSGPSGSYVYSPNDYASYNFTGSVGTGAAANNSNLPDPTNNNSTVPDKYIASGQAFFVKGIASGTVTFENSMREGGTHNNQFFRAPVSTDPIENWDMTGKHRVWLNLTGGTNGFNQTLVGYIQNATNGLDWGFDGDSFGGNIVTLYSIAETKNLVIQGRALPFNNQDQVPLGYKSTVNGTLKIAIDHVDGLFEGQDIYLEDLSLNIVHDLKVSAYSFTSVAGTFNNRFVLRYVPQETLSNPDHENIANGVILYQNDQTINVKSQLETLEQITVYDLLGRIVFDKTGINQNSFSIQNVVMNEQPLIVKIKLTNGQIVNKKIVY